MRVPGIVYEKALSGDAERRLRVLLAPTFQAPSRRHSAFVYSGGVARMLLDSCYSGSCSGHCTFVALKKRYLAHHWKDNRRLDLPEASAVVPSSSSSHFPPPTVLTL